MRYGEDGVSFNSNELGVVVETPDNIIWARNDKTYTIGGSENINTGKMITFCPEGK